MQASFIEHPKAVIVSLTLARHLTEDEFLEDLIEILQGESLLLGTSLDGQS